MEERRKGRREGREGGRKEGSKERRKEEKKEGWKREGKEEGKEGRKSVNGPTYQSHENAEELNDICVGHGVEPAHQGVQRGDKGGDDDGHAHIGANDHADSGSWKDWMRTAQVKSHIQILPSQ